MAVRILIVDSAPVEAQAELARHGGAPHGETYARALRSQMPAASGPLEVFNLAAGDGVDLPRGVALSDFDGAAWTGSPFSAYDDRPIVAHQIGLARAVFESGVPCFGSCWGLQVMTVALGGRVHRHVAGLEFGVGQRITLSAFGRGHPMYRGKPDVFDALCVHQDEVAVLPAGARLLAGNDHSAIQAAEITAGERSFWGVQYHPEYDLLQMAALFSRGARLLVEGGFAHTAADVARMVADFRLLHHDGSLERIARQQRLTRDIIDPASHRLELANWLRVKVLPFAAARSRIS